MRPLSPALPAERQASAGRVSTAAPAAHPRVKAAPQRAPILERLLRTLILWHHRARSRAALRHLDDRLLRDVGLDRATVERIGSKRFWQD